MTFPIVFMSDAWVPLWWHWVGNIGGLIIIAIAIFVAIAFDDCSSKSEEFWFIVGALFIGLLFAFLWATFWGFLLGIVAIVGIPALFLYGLRRSYWGIKDWRFYRKHDL